MMNVRFHRFPTTWLCAAAFVVLAVSCNKDKDDCEDPQNDDFDQATLLENYADNLILPAYTDYSDALTALESAVNAFEANPTLASLNDCRAQWRQAVLQWQDASLYDFGPASDFGLQAGTNTYPTDTALINSNIENGNYNLAIASNIPARGLPSMDYLLFGSGANDAGVLAAFTTDHHATARMTYLKNVVNTMRDDLGYVTSNWDPANGNYRGTFVANTGNSVGSSLGLMLNAFNKSYESYIRTAKLGLPVGAFTFSQTPLPTHVEAYFEADNNVAYLDAALRACERFYLGNDKNGNESTGFDDYLQFLEASYNGGTLDQAIKAQTNEALVAVGGMSDPLSTYVVDQQSAALSAYGELQQLTVLYKVDMMSALGILITYQDNDGD